MPVRLIALLLLGMLARPAAAGETAVILLGSELEAYRQALAGFQQAYEGKTVVFVVGRNRLDLPPEAKVVVAFGRQAALKGDRIELPLVYGLAPGFWLGPNSRLAPTARVSMHPRPATLAAKIRSALPAVKAVAALWSADGYDRYVRELAREAKAAGVELVPAKARGRLPDRLRMVSGRVQALWTPVDPELLTPEGVQALRAFARAEGLTLISSLPGVADGDAALAIAPSFEEFGRTAAFAARDLLRATARDVYYSDSVTVTVGAPLVRSGAAGSRD